MKLKALGRKIVIRMIREKSAIHLPEGAEQKPVKVIVEDIGPDVDINIAIGQEVRLFSLAHIDSHNEHKDLGIVDQADVWATVER